MKKAIIAYIVCLSILAAALFWVDIVGVFQRGNPLPYVVRMFALSDNNPYVRVRAEYPNRYVYITRGNGRYGDLFRHIEDTFYVNLSDQLGTGFFFDSDEISVMAILEIYMGHYVWNITVSRIP